MEAAFNITCNVWPQQADGGHACRDEQCRRVCFKRMEGFRAVVRRASTAEAARPLNPSPAAVAGPMAERHLRLARIELRERCEIDPLNAVSSAA
jgi:hypothetical protein